jgi:hypothetical protein
MRKKIAILGTGYAGIFAAANLCRAKTFDIILIDKSPYYLLLQQIPHIISREKDPEDITICLAEIFRGAIVEGLLKIVHAIIKALWNFLLVRRIICTSLHYEEMDSQLCYIPLCPISTLLRQPIVSYLLLFFQKQWK